MSGRIVAGIGCRSLCPAEDIIDLIQTACAQTGRQAAAIAAPEFKRAEPGLAEAARRLAVPLLFVAEPALRDAQPGCPTSSAAAAGATGIASVAEGSALAASGPGGRLILPRIAGKRATCALAEAAGP